MGWAALVVAPALVTAQAAPATLAAQAPPDSLAADDGGAGGLERIGLGVLVLGTLALFDEPARELALDLQGNVGDGLGDFGQWYGDWKTTAPMLAGGFVLVGVIADGGRGARKAGAAAAGVLATAAVNETINQTFGRSRPREEHGPWRYDPFRGHSSLSSGHTAYAFAIAAAIDEVTNGWIPVPFYLAAGLTGLSRIYDDAHWLSDVVLGGAMGLWIGRRATAGATRLFGVARRPPLDAGAGRLAGLLARIEPVATGRFLGIRIAF